MMVEREREKTMRERGYISVAGALTMEEAEKLRREWGRLHMMGRMGTPTEPEKGLLTRIIGWMRRRKKTG